MRIKAISPDGPWRLHLQARARTLPGQQTRRRVHMAQELRDSE